MSDQQSISINDIPIELWPCIFCDETNCILVSRNINKFIEKWIFTQYNPCIEVTNFIKTGCKPRRPWVKVLVNLCVKRLTNTNVSIIPVIITNTNNSKQKKLIELIINQGRRLIRVSDFLRWNYKPAFETLVKNNTFSQVLIDLYDYDFMEEGKVRFHKFKEVDVIATLTLDSGPKILTILSPGKSETLYGDHTMIIPLYNQLLLLKQNITS